MRHIPTCLLMLAGLAPAALPVHGQQGRSAELWLTTPDRSNLVALQSSRLHFAKAAQVTPATQAAVIDVDDSKTYQTMDGFGFALTGGSAQLLMRMSASHRSALLHELFAAGKTDIGVSYLRVSIGSSDMNERVFTYDDLPEGATDPTLARFNLGPDRSDVIPVLKEILSIQPGIRILASPWSAPSWMKTNGGPKDGSLKPEYYAAYAQYFVKYIQAMKAEGIAIDAITLQNEPLNPHNTPSMVMTAKEEGAFIRTSLGPALHSAAIATKIILYDHNCDVPEYPLAILGDPQAAPYVDGSGFHLYGGEIGCMTQVHDAYPSKNLYFTEQMVVDRPGDSSLHIAGPVSRILIGATRNWSRIVLLWNLAADPQLGPHTDNGGCPVCEGAITLDGDQVTRNLAYYTIAHASKFVPPGSVRIASTSVTDLPNVAFKTAAGKAVLIVANPSASQQSLVIRNHGEEASSTLDAGSVGTYVW